MGYGLLCTPTNYSPYIFLFIQLHLLWPLMHSNKLFPLYLLIASTPPPMDSYGLPASFCYHYSCSSILIYSTPPPMASYALQQIIPLISSYFFNSTSHGLLWTPSFFCYHYSCSSILIYSTPPPTASYALQQIIPLISSYCFNS